MPTVIERIDVSVDTGDLDLRLGAQVEQLRQIARIIGQLIDNPPDDVGDFLDLAANLPVPEFSVDGDFAGTLSGALERLPTNLEGVTGAVTDGLGQFAALVADQLLPLLEDAVRIAGAIEKLVALDFHCQVSPGAMGPGGGGSGGGGPPPDSNPGAERLNSTARQVQQVNDLLDQLPASLTPGGLLEFLFPLVDHKARNKFFQLTLPVIDDIVEPLRTLSRWAAMTPTEVGAELETTLTTLTLRLRAATLDPIDGLGTDLGNLQAQLQLPALTSFADAYGSGLDDLVQALQAADVPGTAAPVAALNDALDDVASTLAVWEGGVAASIEGLGARLEGFADDLLDQICHLLTLLEPVDLPSRLVAVIPPPQAPHADTVAAVREAVQPVIDWLHGLIELLDFSAVQPQISGVASEAQTLAETIEQDLTGVALQVQALFDELGAQLAGLDLTALQGRLNAQIEQFGAGLERQLGTGFSPAANAIGEAIEGLSDALDSFDPGDVVAALQSVLQAITGVLNGSEVQDAVQQVRNAIDAVTETLEQLSFTPVTDEVVALIEQMTQALQQLQQTDLNDAAKAALAVALEVLPDDLKPVTDPLLQEFDGLIETGPVPLLVRVAEKPAELLAAITRFQPRALIGDTLGGPYREALGKAAAFQPSALLADADKALQSAKSALLQSAGPGPALAVLNQPFEALRGALNRYSPDAVLQPLETEIEKAIAQVVAASPVDEIFAQVNRVFALINAALDVPRDLVATMERLSSLLQGFADPDQQLDAWRDGLLDKVLGITNPGDIGAALADLDDAVTASTHAALLNRYDNAVQALVDALADFAPGSRTSSLVSAYHRARSLSNGLADSPQKTAILAALKRLDPSRTPPLRLSQQLEQRLKQARTDLESLAGDWQAMVEDPQGLLAEINAVGADADGLRELLAVAVEPVLAPLRHLFARLEAVRPALAAMHETLDQLVDDLSGGVAALLTGPGSLQSISDAVQQVVDTLRNIDLRVLREGLQALFAQLQEQLDSVNPAQLAQSLDTAFADLLDGIGLDLLIPAGAIQPLDADYNEVLERLRDLDPEVLITEVVQPEFDATVTPLVEAFDLTPAFNALIEFLRGLGDELGGELDRVNSAYQRLRSARPSLAGSIDVNVSF